MLQRKPLYKEPPIPAYHATTRNAANLLFGAIETVAVRDPYGTLHIGRQALEQGRPEDVRIASHSLKSTSTTFGAMALSTLAREMETLARDGRVEGIAEQITRSEAEFARAKTALEAMRYEP